ncbi:GGDEF domain-containing protein [Shewanella sp. D64]|uniref:GGDEF domain-containing protein n=1 Tax=unclassified Shewanella TaxID=196818 RepID=UPI0022BA4D29|nr:MULTISPECIES: GGDEF domain-containing protein [unclassified Shewanella]MEC4725644.1 GGDEF domain-containing protein [Shewanella sp. D64]MEC4739696.1 GGDEF domain-containing protein [Shewanella sp. E94]WBJ94841.1 GGDEF domain-containing protein [Shewanella sp. MTB7]
MNDSGLDLTNQIRSKVLGSLSFTLFIAAISFAIFNAIYHQAYAFATLELIFAGFSFDIFWNNSKKNNYSVNKLYFYLLFLAFLIVFGTYSFPLVDALFVWAFSFPIISYLLLGKRFAFRVSLFVFLSIGTILFIKLVLLGEFDIEPVMINFLFCYICIWTVSHYYELSRASAHDSLIKLAHSDSLTQTNNRLAFSDVFSDHQGEYLLLLDLDDFKSINDTYGHDIGDKVLVLVANCLKTLVDESRVFRIGGEEFCIWLDTTDIERAVYFSEEIRKNVAQQPIECNGQSVVITISGGLAKHKYNMKQSELLKIADNRMYSAKKRGRNQVVHKDELEENKLALVN